MKVSIYALFFYTLKINRLGAIFFLRSKLTLVAVYGVRSTTWLSNIRTLARLTLDSVDSLWVVKPLRTSNAEQPNAELVQP